MTPPEWNTYEPQPAPEEEPAPPRTVEQRTLTKRTGGRRRPAKPLIGAAVAIGLIGWGGVSLGKAVVGNEEPQTVEGFAQLLDDLEQKSGSTDVFEAVIYPGYARVDVPVAPADPREISYRWDGNFSMEIKGTSDEVRFDLAEIDPALFEGMCADVSMLVEDPGDCYLIISQPDDTFPIRANAWISAYVSNEFGQTAHIAYDREGNRVDQTD